MNRLADLSCLTRDRIVQEPLKMKDKNGWKHLEKHLLSLSRLARAKLVGPHWLGVRDVCEGVVDSVYRIRLCKGRLVMCE